MKDFKPSLNDVEELMDKHKKEEFTGKKVAISLLSIVIMLLCQAVGYGMAKLASYASLPFWTNNIFFGVFYAASAYIMLKWLVETGLGLTLKDCRIGRNAPGVIWIIMAIVMPIAITWIMITQPGHMVHNDISASTRHYLITYAIFNVGLGSGIVEELVLRGVIMRAVEAKWDRATAVVIPSFVIGFLGLSGIGSSDPVLIMLTVGCSTMASIMYSLIALDSNSVWSSCIFHGFWNMVMIGGIVSVGSSSTMSSIYTYVLDLKQVYLTGGDQGIGMSLIAIIAYSVISIFAIYHMKVNKER